MSIETTEPYAAAEGLVRVYPADVANARPTAGLVWAHGGGFAAGDLDMPEADWVARAFAARGATVVSIGDGSGRYPAGSDDVHGHLNRPGEPAASVTVDRVVRWLAGLDTAAARPNRPTEQPTTLRITEGITP
jgi:hypothetical protein